MWGWDWTHIKQTSKTKVWHAQNTNSTTTHGGVCPWHPHAHTPPQFQMKAIYFNRNKKDSTYLRGLIPLQGMHGDNYRKTSDVARAVPSAQELKMNLSTAFTSSLPEPSSQEGEGRHSYSIPSARRTQTAAQANPGPHPSSKIPFNRVLPLSQYPSQWHCSHHIGQLTSPSTTIWCLPNLLFNSQYQ